MLTASNDARLNADEQAIVLELAQRSVALGLSAEPPLEPMVEYHSPNLRRWRSSFVTLRQHREIVGRAGTVEPTTALISDICHNAYVAAYNCNQGLSGEPLMIEICVVNGLEQLKCKSLNEVCGQIVRGEHGALMRHTNGAATLTPDSWDRFSDATEFTRQLCERAGVCPEEWQDDAQLLVYRMEPIAMAELCRYQTWRPDKPR